MRIIKPKIKWLVGASLFLFCLILFGVLFFKNNQSLIEEEKKQSGDDKLFISMDKQGLIPFDIMTITGGKFDPEAATTVVFNTFTEQTLSIPALSVTQDKIEVPVPPLAYDKLSGKFSLDVIKFYVIQVKKDQDEISVNTSNELAAIQVISPLTPEILKRAEAKNLPIGLITKEFVALAMKRLEYLEDELNGAGETAKEKIAQSHLGLRELITALESYIENPTEKVYISSATGERLELDREKIVWLDAFYSGFLGLAEDKDLLSRGSEASLSLGVKVAQADTNSCDGSWKDTKDLKEALSLEMTCLYEKIIEEKETENGDEKTHWRSQSFDLMQNLSAGLSSGGFKMENQIAYAVSGYLGPLKPQMTRLIQPNIKSPAFMIIMALAQLLITSDDICSQTPDFCYRREYTIADPFNVREFLFYKYDLRDSLIYRFQTPGQFNRYMFGFNDYKQEDRPKIDPVPDLKPSPAPVSPDKIDYTSPSPSPKPTPTPSPTPTPTPSPDDNADDSPCAESRDETFKKCNLTCEKLKSGAEELSSCYENCDASTTDLIEQLNCENDCRRDWFAASSASASCFSGCQQSYNASDCY